MTYGQRPGEQSWRSGQYPGGNWQWGQGADERPGDPRYARQGESPGLEPFSRQRDDQWQGGDGRWQPPEWRYAQRKAETQRWYDQTYGQQAYGHDRYDQGYGQQGDRRNGYGQQEYRQSGYGQQGSAPSQYQSQQGRPGNGQSSPPPWPSQRTMYAGPGRPPQRGQSWPARHKALTGVSSLAALLVVIIVVANAGKSPSSPGTGTTAGLTTSASPTATRTPGKPAAQAAATTQAEAPQPTQTAATASQPPASAAPVPTAPAAVVVPPPSTAPASCTPLSDEGTCYESGEYCRDDDHGASGVAGDGEAITCADNDGWRWEPA